MLLWLIASIALLFIVLVILLQTYWFQNFVVDKATSWLSKKLKTTVQIEEINIGFPNSLYLKNLFVADQQNDTLLYVHELTVDIAMKSLLKNQAIINGIQLNGATVHLIRTVADSSFNFNFIAAAFSSASPKPEVADTGTSSFNLLLSKATLDNIYFTINDEVGGMIGSTHIGHLEVNFDDFDLANQKIFVDQLNWNDSYAHFRQTKPTVSDTAASSPIKLQLGAKHLNLSNLDLSYSDTTTQLSLISKISLLEGDPDTIDIGKLIFDFKKLKIENTSFYVALGNQLVEDTSAETGTDTTSTNVIARCDALALTNFDFKYDDKTSTPISEGMDYSHLDVSNVTGDFTNIYYEGLNIAVDIHKLQASEKCGLNIKEGYGKFRMTDTGVSFADCLLETDKSIIRDRAGIRYTSLEDINKDVGKLGVFGNLKNASLAVSEILYFYPPLAENEYVKPSVNRVLNIDGKIEGTLNNIQFQNLRVRTNGTEVLASGSIKGLPDTEKLAFDVKLSRFTSTKEELLALLPDSLLPAAIQIPDAFTVSGNYSGSMENFKAAIVLQSSLGNAVVVASMKPVPGKDIQSYDAKVDLENFDLGKFLKQEESIGMVNLSATAVGEGFTIDDMNTEVVAQIKSAEFLDYEYRDVLVNGKIADRSFIGNVTVDDDAVSLAFRGMASLDPENPLYNFDLDVKYADLQKLNLYQDDLKFSGKIEGDFTGDDLSTLNGTIYISDGAIASKEKIISLDSISLIATSDSGKYDWRFRSQVADVDYSGTSSAAIGVPLLINHFNYYFNQEAYRAADTMGRPQFDFYIHFHDQKNLLPVFVEGLSSVSPFTISGTFDGNSKNLKVASTPTNVIYSGVHLDSIILFAGSNSDRFSYNVSAEKIRRDTLEVNGLSVSGYAQHDSVIALISIKPDSNHVDLLLGGSVATTGNKYRVHLLPDQLVFDQQKWSVPDDNFIQFGPEGIFAHNLKIFREDSFLLIQSTEEQPGSPMEFTFNKFDLQLFSRVIDSSGQIITGMMNGNFLIKDFKTFNFNSALTITDLSLLGERYGNLSLDAKNDVVGKYDIKLNLQGAGNGINILGYYMSTPESNELHFDALIDSANFSLIEPFANPYISDLHGSLHGNLRIRGSTSVPSINGTIAFDTAKFTVSYTNTALSLGDEPVLFDDSGIHFNSLSVRDPLGNSAHINGDLFTTDYINYQFALDVNATDFVAMNSTSEVTTDYYGVLRLDFNARLRGNMSQPDIGLRAKLRDGTNLTYIYQRSDTTFNTEEGIVEFIDISQRLDSLLAQKDTVQSMLAGYNISAFLEVDKKSVFNIVVDPVAGDRLEVKGDGSFNYDVNPSGRMTLTGRYEIDEGSYNLTLYNVVKRKFILDKGSTINWTGDAVNANIDIRGHMIVRTSPFALIGSQAAMASDEQQAQYKNPLDFDVFLIMNGQLLAPEISFDIQLSEKDQGALDGVVDAKLAELRRQEGEMNKQVFALMVLNTFIAEDPTAGAGSDYISDVARGSVSSMMSSQLNKLSSQYIKGVDVTFDLKSVTDYSSGVEQDKTQLNVGFREKLFNDRLQIYVGTNFDIGGSEVFSAKPSDLSGDFSLEYLVRPDGRVRLNIFRKNTYEGIFEGQTVESGVSVIYNRDYNSLRQIFQKAKAARKEKKIEKKEAEKITLQKEQ